MSPALCHIDSCPYTAIANCLGCPESDRSLRLCAIHAGSHHAAGHDVVRDPPTRPPTTPPTTSLREMITQFLPELREALASIPDAQIRDLIAQIRRLVEPLVVLSNQLDEAAALAAADTVNKLVNRGWPRQQAMEFVINSKGDSTSESLRTMFELVKQKLDG